MDKRLAEEIDETRRSIESWRITIESAPHTIERIDEEIAKLQQRRARLEKDIVIAPGLLREAEKRLADLIGQRDFKSQPFYRDGGNSRTKKITRLMTMLADIEKLRKEIDGMK